MKITIEVDVEPNEVQLATELMATLRALTEHVTSAAPVMRVNGVPAASAPSGPSPVSASAAPTSRTSSISPVPNGLPASVPPAMQAPMAVAAAPAQMPLGQHLEMLISQCHDRNNLNIVLPQIVPLLQSSDGAVDEFVEAFARVVFPPVDPMDPLAMQRTISPYMDMLAMLPEPYMSQVKGQKGITPKVLKHLTIKRTVDVGRACFYAQCEAFAWLAANGFVGLEGAVKTLTKMLDSEGTRSAAVTMLGKTAELCSAEMPKQVAPEVMQKLMDTLSSRVTDLQLFGYDLAYIVASLQWPQHLFPGIEAYSQ